MQDNMHLLNLPDLCLEHIFSFLSYDEVAKKRNVSFFVTNVKKLLRGQGLLKKKMINNVTCISSSKDLQAH